MERVKSVTLRPGRWVYVCPCGMRYVVGIVTSRNTRHHALYCFRCKQQTGKYRESMEERIDFTKNPNGVLNCGCFPLIRLASPLGNAVGSLKQIYLRGIYKGKAEVVSCDTLFLSEIRKAHAYLFMGEDTEMVRKAIKRRYADRKGINWETQRVDFVVRRDVKEDNTLCKQD